MRSTLRDEFAVVRASTPSIMRVRAAKEDARVVRLRRTVGDGRWWLETMSGMRVRGGGGVEDGSRDWVWAVEAMLWHQRVRWHRHHEGQAGYDPLAFLQAAHITLSHHHYNDAAHDKLFAVGDGVGSSQAQRQASWPKGSDLDLAMRDVKSSTQSPILEQFQAHPNQQQQYGYALASPAHQVWFGNDLEHAKKGHRLSSLLPKFGLGSKAGVRPTSEAEVDTALAKENHQHQQMTKDNPYLTTADAHALSPTSGRKKSPPPSLTIRTPTHREMQALQRVKSPASSQRAEHETEAEGQNGSGDSHAFDDGVVVESPWAEEVGRPSKFIEDLPRPNEPSIITIDTTYPEDDPSRARRGSTGTVKSARWNLMPRRSKSSRSIPRVRIEA
ncbi:hypothetical protein PYCC9005_004534 [Savitreella phatthalungensis]